MSQAGSYLIDRHAAEKAVGLALPMIQEAMKLKEVGESGFLYIVMMDPLRGPTNSSFEEAILYEYSVGDRSKWDADYAGFARAKARVAWRTGMDSHLVQELRPHLLAAGDTVLWGTAIVDGITVGVSGANPWYDEAFAGTVAMCLRAVAKAGIVQERKNSLFLQPK
ncbi:MAG TPA: hypothetical protein VEB70_10740 [Noviherbaspirillum sp.]|nr:hypothetical protein [Noviherbaspirillum sp.]